MADRGGDGSLGACDLTQRLAFLCDGTASLLLSLALLLPAGAARGDDAASGDLFKNQCGTCHVVSQTAEERQGPNLFGVIGRPAGKLKGFKYSPAMAKAKFTWTKEKIDGWLTDTAALVPGSVMNYRQADPAIRAKIIDYLAASGGMAK